MNLNNQNLRLLPFETYSFNFNKQPNAIGSIRCDFDYTLPTVTTPAAYNRMNSTLTWPVFANVQSELRQKIESVFVFGKNGDKLIFFTKTTPKTPPPTPASTPNSERASENDKTESQSSEDAVKKENGQEVVVISDDAVHGANTTYEAFILGKNTASCLGVGEWPFLSECKKLDSLSGRKVIQIASGERLHVVALTDNGQVLAWGENRHGQVGVDTFEERVREPAVIFDSFNPNQTVVQVAAGMAHSACLTNLGKVYTWGHNDFGQLGDGTKMNKATPICVEGGCIDSCVIEQVGCCQRSTLALDNKGHVFQWGNSWNDNGVNVGQPITRPQSISAMYAAFQHVRVTKLACGTNHVLALAESSAIYGWGRNNYGQLGLGYTGDGGKIKEAPILQPAKIRDFSTMRVRIKDILAYNQSNVSIAQSFSGTVFVWGRQSSTGSEATRPVPTTFKTMETAFVASCHSPVTSSLQKIEHDKYGTAITGAPSWLREMFDHRPSSDLELVVEGQSIYVHRAILKMGSSHFRAMLDAEHWKESKEPVIKIDKTPYTVYRAYLFYIYADELVLPANVTQEDVIGLLDLASSYLEDDLILKTVDFFAGKWLDVDNAAAIYTLAIDRMLDELSAVCMEFIFENLTDVVSSQSFSELEPQHAKTIFIKAAYRKLFAI